VCVFAEQVDKSGSSALHKACAKGHSAAAEVMLAVDSDPDPRDNCRQTPLHKVRGCDTTHAPRHEEDVSALVPGLRNAEGEPRALKLGSSRMDALDSLSPGLDCSHEELIGLPQCHHTAPSSIIGTCVGLPVRRV
jgi:hypothetical protein